MPEPELFVLDRATVERCALGLDPVDVVESVLRSHGSGRTVLPAEAYMEWSNQAAAYCRSVAMPGGIHDYGASVYGMKIINAAITNPAIGLDRAGGVIMLFDPETSRPWLLADAAYLSALRTAAYTMLSMRYLSPPACTSVSVIGCGALARAHLRLLVRYFPGVSTAWVYDIDRLRAEALAAWAARTLPGLSAVPCASAREAVAASTTLFTLTTSRKPYIELSWFQPGSFVAHVSLDDLTEEVFLGAEAIFVDDVPLVRDNPRRILGSLMAAGKIRAPGCPEQDGGREIMGTLDEVLTGRRQAIRPRDAVVVSNPFGMSVLDIGMLERVARIAQAGGLGRRLAVFGSD
jgi:N-[(2S)-2-amino-2-carboxyethyl]-L-glutamate dehydrogenase